jgi:tRNA A37 methylthiotransferase MiaB
MHALLSPSAKVGSEDLMKTRVALVEFPIYDQFPLASAYLEGYASKDSEIARAFEFVYYRKECDQIGSYQEVLNDVRNLNTSIVCMSCYVWNSGLVRRLIQDLNKMPEVKHVIMGGHQITHHLEKYVATSNGKSVVVNGQGEVPFPNILRRILEEKDCRGLQGVSCFVEGELWNGGEAEVVRELDTIPSPFLTGRFDNMKAPIAVLETNRGCPFRCTFCTWGFDTSRVSKFSTERVQEELLWIAKKQVPFIYIADANWGMLPRDLVLSENIAQMRKDHGYPLMVYYAAAKNSPKNTVACIEKLYQGGVITSQALGIQSLNPKTLEAVERKNIRNSAFFEMFRELKEKNIDSFAELIWPLPNETLDTLQLGFQKLIELGAPTVIMYSAHLINNAKMTTQADEHGMEMVECFDWKSEAHAVRKTKDVDTEGVLMGLRFYYAFFLLANCDPFKAILRFLSEVTGKGYAELVSDFVEYLNNEGRSSPYARHVNWLFDEDLHQSSLTVGRTATHITHEERLSAQTTVFDFALSKVPDSEVDAAITLLLVWALSLPKLFADSRDDVSKITGHLQEHASKRGFSMSNLCEVKVTRIGANIEIKNQEVFRRVGQFFVDSAPLPDQLQRVEIVHTRRLLRFQGQDIKKVAHFAHGMINRLRHSAPSVSWLPAGDGVLVEPMKTSSQARLAG